MVQERIKIYYNKKNLKDQTLKRKTKYNYYTKTLKIED